ncbi:hypothetical protein GW915_13000 [bacterium]|nr:hypothetical protein [bacterium]
MSEFEEKREPLLHHMKSLGVALKNVIFCIFIGGALGYVFSSEILAWLTAPYSKVMGANASLIYISPFEKIWVHLRVAMWGGVFVVLPAIYVSAYGFFKPALLSYERKSLNIFAILAFGVAVLGLVLGQKYVIPLLLEALVGFKGAGETAFISLGAYVGMSLGVLVATALLLELPLIMLEFSLLGWVDSTTWRKGRRVAIVVNAAVSAFLSPPDVLSMLVLMLPIQVLYECGIMVSRMAEWKRHATEHP